MAAPQETFSKMSVGDVEAIGAHCQMTFCHQLDFLPFRCESCTGKFCLEHRTESAHQCPQAGAWAKRRAQVNGLAPRASTPRPTILTHEQQCSHSSCKTLIDTPLVTGVLCETCNRRYCLKHRLTYDHECSKLPPVGARTAAAQATRERGLAALEKLRAWGQSKKSTFASKSAQGKTKISAAARLKEVTDMKTKAKGDSKIPVDKRIYLFVEASADTLSAKIPKGTFFYSVDYSVGRMLDIAATSLQVDNINNKSDNEEDKLRVFHIEGGRLLKFSDKLGSSVQTGNTVVLLRGVGADMADTPNNTS